MTRITGRIYSAKCPRCQGFKDVRQVPTEPGYDPRLEHWCCDSCEIGWYQYPNATNVQLGGDLAAAKAAYVPLKLAMKPRR